LSRVASWESEEDLLEVLSDFSEVWELLWLSLDFFKEDSFFV